MPRDQPAAPGMEPVAPTVAVVLPVLNEAGTLAGRLRALVDEGRFDEIIVVDGGSSDGTAEIVARLAPAGGGAPRPRLLAAPRGRAHQMNAGAAAARAGVLLFLHADTVPPPSAAARIREAVAGGAIWGRFDVRLDAGAWSLRVVERLMNLRAAVTGIATGDQAIFVRRTAFQSLGGYAPIPLMEDLELCRRLRRLALPARIREPVLTSARRWLRGGVVRTILRMWTLRFLYWAGVPPERLSRWYPPVR